MLNPFYSDHAAGGAAAHKRILLADDDLINAMITEHVLQLDGFSIQHVINGKEAVKVFEQHPEDYALILMDVQMPEMDGLAATKAIRLLQNGTAVPILGLTASILEKDVQQCYDAGMNAHMFKPYEPEQLINKIKSLLLIDKN